MKALASEAAPVRHFAFGPFTADPIKRILREDGEIVPLTGKAFDLLIVLLSRAGEVVEKDELLRLVWPDTVVEENNLVRHISMLRKTLNDSLSEHLYIVTIAGRGYRFVAEVTQTPMLSDVASAAPLTPPLGLPVLSQSPAPSPALSPAPSPALSPALSPPLSTALSTAPDPPREPEPSVVAAPPAPRLRSWIVGGIVGAVLGVTAFAFWLRAAPASTPAPVDRSLRQFSFEPGLVRTPTWSPDGRWLAFSSERDGNVDIWIQPTGSGSTTRLTDSPAVDEQPSWSPDGKLIAFRSERDGGGLFVAPAGGGAVRRITSFGYKPAWSPDGSRILFISSVLEQVREAPRVFLADPSTGATREVLAGLLSRMRWPHIAWHPDGAHLSVWGNHQRAGWSLWTVSLADESRSEMSAVDHAVQREIDAVGVQLREFAWSPTARAIYFEGTSQGVTNVWRIEVDPETRRWIGGPKRLTTGPGLARDFTLSADGRRLALTIQDKRTRLWSLSFDAAGGRLTGDSAPLTIPNVDASYPDLSRDGARLAYRIVRGNREELWSRSLVTGEEQLLLSTEDAPLVHPHWSPDGAALAYLRRGLTSESSGDAAVALLALGRQEERLLTTPGSGATAQDWSPDGRTILGRCAADERALSRLCLFPVAAAPHAERSMRELAADPAANVWQGRFSPDGRWVVFNTIKPTEAEVSTVFVVPAAGGPWVRISEGAAFDDKARWAPDGRTIYFLSNRAASLNIWGRRVDPATGQPQGAAFQVTHFEGSAQMISTAIAPLGMAVSRDRLVVPITSLSGNVWILENVDR